MEQIKTGKFIALKRKAKNLTQEQLAQKLGVSNKTISKWETGKCMPDYAIIKQLCEELEITIAELIDGENSHKSSVYSYQEQQMLDMLKRVQNLEKQKNLLFGFILIFTGIALLVLSRSLGGSDIRDFFAGLLLGVSIGETLGGIYIVARTFGGVN